MSKFLPEDRTEIKVVGDERRSAWTRHALPDDYWCGKCGHWHRSTSMIGKAHRIARRSREEIMAVIAEYRSRKG